MRAVVDAVSAVSSWVREYGRFAQATAPGGEDAFAQAFAQNLSLDTDKLSEALRHLYADSWLVGAKDAESNLGDRADPSLPLAAAVSGLDWDDWRPGHPEAADLLAGTGFERMLEEAGVVLREIDHTTRERIGKALADGVRAGDSVEQIALAIDSVLGDLSRAMMIATTEVNRAMTAASVEMYRRNGVAQWDLLTSPGACPVCTAIAAANPHPMSDTADAPPVHPRCRCAVAAAPRR